MGAETRCGNSWPHKAASFDRICSLLGAARLKTRRPRLAAKAVERLAPAFECRRHGRGLATFLHMLPPTNFAESCDPRATAIRIAGRYCGEAGDFGCFAMMAYVVSEGRLFALKPSEWVLMLIGVGLTGLLTLLV
jgi:hypothetical protein